LHFLIIQSGAETKELMYLCSMIYTVLLYFGLLLSGCNGSKEIPRHDSYEHFSLIVNDCISASYIMGQFDPSVHPDFVEIPTQFADQKGRFIRKEVLEAFEKMFHAAKKEGVHLVIKSATRNFDAQKKIWEDKWFGRKILEDGTNAWKDIHHETQRALKILEYSSMPGTSRHHWGTDIDLNAFTNSFFEKGEGLKIYQWLQNNAAKFGFCQTYTSFDQNRKTGYQPEKWHWSYTPVSVPLTRWAQNNLSDTMISGFAGCETAGQIKIVQNYILGIHSDCFPSKE
jgi:D-alanyl-D-alanine carboxypeptidase